MTAWTPPWPPELQPRLTRIRLAVLDVDGTLLTSRHEVTPGVRQAVHDAQAAGLEVMLASSRGPSALKPVLDDLHAAPGTPFVASQGAVAGSFDADGLLQVARHRPAPLEEALAVARHADALGLSVSWYAGREWLVTRVDAAVELEAEITHSAPTVADLSRRTEGPDKLMIIAPPDRLDGLRAVKAALGPGLLGQISNPTYLEITAAGVDKAAAVLHHAAARGHEASTLLVMGDGPNDLGMFAVAGLSVAPANARPEVLAAADAVSPSNDEDGVAFVLSALVRARAAGLTPED